MADRRQASLVGGARFYRPGPYVRGLVPIRARRTSAGIRHDPGTGEHHAKHVPGLRSAIVTSELATKRPAANSEGQITPKSS